MDKTKDIIRYLQDVEREHCVRVLLAVESGSRAWGFESANSDWDVRFIYVHKPEWYFSIVPQRDVIEHMYDDDVDLAGWDLKKALTLLRQSNPSLFEWLHSPIVYYQDEEFMRRIREVESDCFNPIRVMYHYNHIYLKHDARYLQREHCKMKVFFYYLRGILGCMWIDKNNTLPPVPFKELVVGTVEDANLRGKIDDLIRIKKSGEECDQHVVDAELFEYANHWAEYYNERIESFRPELNDAPTEALDAILYDMVMLQHVTQMDNCETKEDVIMYNGVDNSLDDLKQAAFEILLENPGSDRDDWQQELISNYSSELSDAYGDSPEDVYASLDDLWESPYCDPKSGLEYDYEEWAAAFATEQSVQMYYDMIDKLKGSVNEDICGVATKVIEDSESKEMEYYKVKGKQTSLSFARHGGTLSEYDLRQNLIDAMEKSNVFEEDWLQDLQVDWYQKTGIVPGSDVKLLEDKGEMEKQVGMMLDPWISTWRTDMLLKEAGVGEKLIPMTDEEIEDYFSEEGANWTLGTIIREHLPYESPMY